MSMHATTILAVRKAGKVIIAGDGQVTLDKTVLKANAKKVRRLGDGSVIAGFAGSTADAFTLFERFEGKVERVPREHRARRAWSSARTGAPTASCASSRRCSSWPTRSAPSCSAARGDVIEPDEGSIAIGSGGPYAYAAARALLEHSSLDARQIARGGAAHRRRHLHLHQPESRLRGALSMAQRRSRRARSSPSSTSTSSASARPSGPWPSRCATVGGGSTRRPSCATRSRRRTSS